MFAKTIVESGDFYNLSIKAQNLYFHLGMLADDDGFLNNALVICRGCGFTKATLQELIDRRFILDCGDNIHCVKHWLINNTVPKDRKKDTIYKDKLEKLHIKDNKSYTDRHENVNKLDTECIQNVNKLDTQDRYRLDIDTDIVEEDCTARTDTDIGIINARYREMGVSESVIEKAMKIYKQYKVQTSVFYQSIMNTLTDDSIYNKEGYIYEIANNYIH